MAVHAIHRQYNGIFAQKALATVPLGEAHERSATDPRPTRDPARPSTELDHQLSLEQVVDRKTQELEAERERLSKALEALHATQGQLVQAQKLESIGQLAAGIAHEINTPAQYVTDNVGFVRHASTLLLTLVDRLMPLLEAARSGAGKPSW